MKKERNAHIFDRHEEEWYVEPGWCSARLFDVQDFSAGVFDPACGRGTIIRSAKAAGIKARGSDIVLRGRLDGVEEHEIYQADFLGEWFRQHAIWPADNKLHIVSNHPFDKSQEFAERALNVVGPGFKVALIFPTRRLNAAGAWLRFTPLTTIYYLTPRPSMPTGDVVEALEREGKSPSGGTVDFCWLVWERGYVGAPTAAWLHRNKTHA